jgi:hypothetical protein
MANARTICVSFRAYTIPHIRKTFLFYPELKKSRLRKLAAKNFSLFKSNSQLKHQVVDAEVYKVVPTYYSTGYLVTSSATLPVVVLGRFVL